MARKDTWTREQLIMALNVYCKIPFKDVKEWHPIIQKYAPLKPSSTPSILSSPRLTNSKRTTTRFLRSATH